MRVNYEILNLQPYKILTMKKILIILVIYLIANHAFASVDTLRHYNQSASQYYYNTNTYPYQVARFVLPKPGYIFKVLLTLDGDTGSVMLHMLGHDAGTSWPQWHHEIIQPVYVHKTQPGKVHIPVLINPPVFLANNQFFIGVSDFSTGVRLMYANGDAPSCISTDGGEYYYCWKSTSYPPSTTQTSTTFSVSSKAYAIDVIIDYPGDVSEGIFQDITIQAGLPTNMSNASISADDFNRDGYIDLLVYGRLFRNNGDETFTELTASSGFSGAGKSVFMDMNNDGNPDVVSFGDYSSNIIIFLNNGNETFTSYPFPVSFQFGPIQTINVADANEDGYPDVFISQLWTTYGTADPAWLLYNDQNLGFTNESELLFPAGQLNGNSRGAMWCDYDNDGNQDLYIANYVTQYNPPRDRLFRNNGDGTFTNIISQTPLDNNSHNGNPFFNMSTGVDFCDYDNDGDMDVLLPTLSHPHYMAPYDTKPTLIFKNSGAPDFDFVQQVQFSSEGVEYEETHAGASWADVNNDGLPDIIIYAFYGCRYIDLYLQNPDHTFSLKSFAYGINNIVTATDAVWVDFNNDGRLDLCGGDLNQFRLFKNTDAHAGNYVEIDLEATTSNICAVGSRATVYCNGQTYTREVSSGKGELMQHPTRLHFGLGSALAVDSAFVRWHGNQNETFYNLLINNINHLTEGGQVTYSGNSTDGALLGFSGNSGCGFSSSENISVNIANFGYDTITAFDAVYSADGVPISPETVNQQILPGQTITYTFLAPADLSAPGLHELSAMISVIGDQNHANDTLLHHMIESGISLDLGPDQELCEGDFVKLAINPEFSFSSLQWSTGGGLPFIYINQTGSYSVSVTDMCGNVITDETEVIIHPGPVVDLGDDISLPQGETCSLDAGNPGSSFLWSTGETTQTIIVDTSGLFFVIVTDQYGCNGEDYINVTGINLIGNPAASSLSVYPNPATEVLFIEPGNGIPEMVLVYNSLGELVKQINPSPGIIKMDIKDMSSGIYSVIVLTKSNLTLKDKVIIER